jgi:hypothetical protein
MVLADGGLAWQDALDRLVEDRNQLVHNLHASFDLRTPAGLEVLDQHLQAQFHCLRGEFLKLKTILEARTKLAEFIADLPDELVSP